MATRAYSADAPPRRSSAGFTLIEILLAMVLMSAVFAAIAAAVSFSGQAIRSGEEKIEDAESLLLTYRILRQAVSRAYALPDNDDPESRIEFEGYTDRLRLVAFLPPYPQAAGAYEVEFQVETNAATVSELWLRRKLYRPNGQDGTAAQDTKRFLVYRGERSLAFSYYGPGKGASSPIEWQDAWQDRAVLPRLVRLTFADRNGGSGRWPEIILRPRSSPAAICVQLPALPLCLQEPQR